MNFSILKLCTLQIVITVLHK